MARELLPVYSVEMVTLRLRAVLLLAATALPIAPLAAQTTTPVTLSLTSSATAPPATTGTVTFTLTGTATLSPLGTSTITGGGTLSIVNANATTPINGTFVLAFSTSDSITMSFVIPAGVVITSLGTTQGVSGSATIVGGTGRFSGATGGIPKLDGAGVATGPLSGNFQLSGPGTVTVPPPGPSIKASGVVSAGAYGAFPDISPGGWVEIYGSNLSATTRSWTGADFTANGQNAPTSLDGVRVTAGGQPAFVAYVSPGQVNALIPSNTGVGPQLLTLSNANGTSASYAITVRTIRPGLLAPPSLLFNNRQYVGALVPNTATLKGTPANPAVAGETLIVYGVGFGPVTPTVNAGTISSQLTAMTTKPQFLFGSTQADVAYYGLAPGFTGLYQFNIVVPNITAGTAVPLTFNVGGIAGTQTLFIAVQ